MIGVVCKSAAKVVKVFGMCKCLGDKLWEFVVYGWFGIGCVSAVEWLNVSVMSRLCPGYVRVIVGS